MMTLKERIVTACALVLLLIGLAFAQGVFNSFTAGTQGDFAILEWTSGSENGLSEYQVERSLDGLDFITIDTVFPLGSNTTYIYEDHDLYKGSNRTYYYRICALMNNGSRIYTSVESVTLSISGIQQTWGSIKALFR